MIVPRRIQMLKVKYKIRHKYLEGTGINSPNDMISYSGGGLWEYIKTRRRYNREFRKYKKTGVFEPNTWALDFSLYAWMYENLCCYEEVCNCDLTYYKFEYEGKKYTQGEMISLLKNKIQELVRDDSLYSLDSTQWEESRKLEKEVLDIWYLVSRSMWW